MTSNPTTAAGPLDRRVPGLLRRIRRTADLSQRDLARRLGVSQSRVARWETGRVSPTIADLERAAALAGLTLALHDPGGRPAVPMRDDAARDRAGRRFPAHVDLWARGWRETPGSSLTAGWWAERAAAQATGDVRIAYDRTLWRSVFRRIDGVPDDHPPRAALVAQAWAETARTPPRRPD